MDKYEKREAFFEQLYDKDYNLKEFGATETTVDDLIAALQKIKEENGGKNVKIGLHQTSMTVNDYDHYVDVALAVLKEENGEKTSEVIVVGDVKMEFTGTCYSEDEANSMADDMDDDEFLDEDEDEDE